MTGCCGRGALPVRREAVSGDATHVRGESFAEIIEAGRPSLPSMITPRSPGTARVPSSTTRRPHRRPLPCGPDSTGRRRSRPSARGGRRASAALAPSRISTNATLHRRREATAWGGPTPLERVPPPMSPLQDARTPWHRRCTNAQRQQPRRRVPGALARHHLHHSREPERRVHEADVGGAWSCVKEVKECSSFRGRCVWSV